jgi:hypothetical protein
MGKSLRDRWLGLHPLFHLRQLDEADNALLFVLSILHKIFYAHFFLSQFYIL